MRILVAASGGEGHLGPLLPFVDAAASAGDEVMVVAPPDQQETLRAGGYRYELSPGAAPAAVEDVRSRMAAADREGRGRLAEVELFGRLCTEAALPTLEEAAARFRPELILREPCDYASAVVGLRREVATAQVAISPGPADWNGLHLAAEVIERIEAGVTAFVERAPHLTRFPRVTHEFPDTRAYAVGTPIEPREVEEPPLVWITFGTVNSSFAALESTWRVTLDAIEGLPVQAIASVGRTGRIMEAPTNARVVGWTPMPEVLARASAVVCHGGSGTTLAALAAGVPLVVIPLLADQHTNAAMVEDLHAGISIRTDVEGGLRGLRPVDTARVREAIDLVLTDHAYMRAAGRVAHSLADRPDIATQLNRLRTGIS